VEALVMDFGLAMKNPTAVARAAVGQGTRPYMAPEVLVDSGLPTDLTKIDVYAFGCVLWEMLSGNMPWESLFRDECDGDHAKWRPRLTENVVGGERPQMDVAWPQDLRQMMQACWADDPAARPTMADVVSGDWQAVERAQREAVEKKRKQKEAEAQARKEAEETARRTAAAKERKEATAKAEAERKATKAEAKRKTQEMEAERKAAEKAAAEKAVAQRAAAEKAKEEAKAKAEAEWKAIEATPQYQANMKGLKFPVTNHTGMRMASSFSPGIFYEWSCCGGRDEKSVLCAGGSKGWGGSAR
jgi:hypothetical protein